MGEAAGAFNPCTITKIALSAFIATSLMVMSTFCPSALIIFIFAKLPRELSVKSYCLHSISAMISLLPPWLPLLQTFLSSVIY